MKKIALVIALVVLALVSGYTLGRQHTIRQADLCDITETEYLIDFGGEVHIYEREV